MNAATLPKPPDRLDSVAIVGGGPAGLMAAEVLTAQGLNVDLYDAMPSVGRKFLLAGRGGLNLTHSEPLEPFLARYAEAAPWLDAMVRQFDGPALRDWVHAKGIDTFVGTSGRVFPSEMKAAPLLRTWLHDLRLAGLKVHTRHRWLGFAEEGRALRFAHAGDGERTVRHTAVVLAVGGASWRRLGSDGAWVPWLAEQGVDLSPLRASNCGFDVATSARHPQGWSEHLSSRFAGQPVKPVVLSFTDAQGRVRRQQGEFVVTQTGVEGSLIYAFSAAIRDHLAQHSQATIELDLLPNHSAEQVLAETQRARGPRSLSTHLKSRLGITGLKMALLHETLSADQLQDPEALARALKALPISLAAARPIDEAISTAGGVKATAVDEHLMLHALPGVFCAGEMLDWEAPTGGYLLNASLATGRQAGLGVAQWLKRENPGS